VRRVYFPFCALMGTSVYVVDMHSDSTRCSRLRPPLASPSQPTDEPLDLRLERHQVPVCTHLHPADCPEQCHPERSEGSAWMRSVVCCVEGVPRVLIREGKAFGPRCCPWSRVPGSMPRPMTRSLGGTSSTKARSLCSKGVHPCSQDHLFFFPSASSSALHGILNMIRDLGLPLLEVRCLEPETASGADL
jgi:hypothetical protein